MAKIWLKFPNMVLDSFVIKSSCYVLNGYLKSSKHIKIAPPPPNAENGTLPTL